MNSAEEKHTGERKTDQANLHTLRTVDNKEDPTNKTLHRSDDLKDHASVVAAHYNHIAEAGLKERLKSPIFYLRNFNNWVKSVLIQKYTNKIREKNHGKHLFALDICCGKGGDLIKWQKAAFRHVVFADIAEVSLQQCKARFDSLRYHPFTAEFIAADCTKKNIRGNYKDPSIRFDIVSCQFGLHYSFESLSQVRCMLKNATECLRPGGYFIGTIPNAYEIVSRAKKSPNGEFGNRIYSIKLLFDSKDGYPLFGAKYDFQLEGVVNCPEYLVNFDLFKKLASEYGLEIVYKASLEDFYKEHLSTDKNLLHKIMCLESYPPPSGKELIGDDADYEHAKLFCENFKDMSRSVTIGTMSKSEWEVATVYMAFAFKKSK